MLHTSSHLGAERSEHFLKKTLLGLNLSCELEDNPKTLKPRLTDRALKESVAFFAYAATDRPAHTAKLSRVYCLSTFLFSIRIHELNSLVRTLATVLAQNLEVRRSADAMESRRLTN